MHAETFRHQPALNAGAMKEIPVRFIRLPEVRAITGLSRSQLYRLVQAGQFPAHIKLGASASAWVESEVLQWCAARIAASRDQRSDA